LVYLNVKDEAVKDQIGRAIFVDKNGLLATVSEGKAANFIIAFLSNPVKENETGQIKADWIVPNPKGQMIAYRVTAGQALRIVWIDYNTRHAADSVKALISEIVEARKAEPKLPNDHPFEVNLAAPHQDDGIVRPRMLVKTQAVYEEEAKRAHVQGTVVLNVVFTSYGTLEAFCVIKGLPYGLTARAIEAALKVKFQPATRNGVPLSVRADLQYTFALD
jgi:TonB family protein